MNETLAGLITKAKAAQKAYDKALKKFPAWKLEDVEGANLDTANAALAKWIIKNTDKLRSVE